MVWKTGKNKGKEPNWEVVEVVLKKYGGLNYEKLVVVQVYRKNGYERYLGDRN